MTETLHSMALTRISRVPANSLMQLYRTLGSATAIIEHHKDIGDIIPDASPRLIEALADINEPIKRAEAEMEYAQQNSITPIAISDPRYPQRMRECDDAPLVLYYKGTADLNRLKVISIVGTRHCTQYGQDIIRSFMADLHEACPDVLVVSGLAYGVDICAHREALDNGYDTVAVLAHGLDMIYPNMHRNTAERMCGQGGLLTEYMTQTNPDKRNFIQRNRIVAGMSDACIVIESAAKGGGLITAGIASSYNRDVFAFPGAVTAKYSKGCNNLIRDTIAGLTSNADDFVKAMGWDTDNKIEKAKRNGIERNLFPELTEEERSIVDSLSRGDLNINMLMVQLGFSATQLSTILFTLEMKGVVKALAGGTYHLLK